MKKLLSGSKLKALLLLAVLPSVSWAGNCVMGSTVNGTTSSILIEVAPDAAIGTEIGSRRSNNYYREILTFACTGSSDYRSATSLTASSTVKDAYETGIPGVGVVIEDLYEPNKTVPYSAAIPPNTLSPWKVMQEIKVTFVKTGAITPGSVGRKVYSTYYLNSKPVGTLTVPALQVSLK